MEKDWKLKLRYGKLTTPFKHYTLLGECVVGVLQEGFECRPGSAVVGMKIWASDTSEVANVFRTIGEQIGYKVVGNIEVYQTDPVEPPGDLPFGYDLQFTPFDEKDN